MQLLPANRGRRGLNWGERKAKVKRKPRISMSTGARREQLSRSNAGWGTQPLQGRGSGTRTNTLSAGTCDACACGTEPPFPSRILWATPVLKTSGMPEPGFYHPLDSWAVFLHQSRSYSETPLSCCPNRSSVPHSSSTTWRSEVPCIHVDEASGGCTVPKMLLDLGWSSSSWAAPNRFPQ